MEPEKKRWNKEKIQALAKKPYEELTSEERRVLNLNKGFWEKGDVPNPIGRNAAKHSTHWSAQFRRLLNDKRLLRTIITSTPEEWKELAVETPAEFIAACVITVTARGVAKAAMDNKKLDADTRACIALLNKIGFGDKVVLDADNGFFAQPSITYQVIPDRKDFTEPQKVIEAETVGG